MVFSTFSWPAGSPFLSSFFSSFFFSSFLISKHLTSWVMGSSFYYWEMLTTNVSDFSSSMSMPVSRQRLMESAPRFNDVLPL